MYLNSLLFQPAATRQWQSSLIVCCVWGLVWGLVSGPTSASLSAAMDQETPVLTADELDVALVANPDGKIIVVIKGLPDDVQQQDASSLVKVWLSSADRKSTPPIMGKTIWKKNALIFQPRFEFIEGQAYFVLVSVGAQNPQGFSLKLKQAEMPVATVTAIYPSAARIPENTLRFYVHFSQPMQQGDIYRFIRIRDESEQPIELPFLEIEQELWSRDGRRLTLLLDPGRIKRGLKPREEMGPIFVAGKRYELWIDGRWPDANRHPLGEDVIKAFSAGGEDHVQPNPAHWELGSPPAGSRLPLVIALQEPLDQAMLHRVLTVLNPDGSPLNGEIQLGADETTWEFSPSDSWKPGTYEIRIDNRLEDLAGNSIEKPFDVDIFDKTEPTPTAFSSLRFVVKALNK